MAPAVLVRRVEMSTPSQHEKNVGAEVIAIFQSHKPVAVAFWAKEQDRALWNLYIATSDSTPEPKTADYTELIRLTRHDIDLFEIALRVILISGSSKMAKAASYLARRGKGRSNDLIEFDNSPLGDVAIDGAFLYPNFETATASAAP